MSNLIPGGGLLQEKTSKTGILPGIGLVKETVSAAPPAVVNPEAENASIMIGG